MRASQKAVSHIGFPPLVFSDKLTFPLTKDFPRKAKFFFDKMNLVDFVAIIPFYIALLLEGLEDMEIIGKAGKIIRLIR